MKKRKEPRKKEIEKNRKRREKGFRILGEIPEN
jgi:hypothetical protein